MILGRAVGDDHALFVFFVYSHQPAAVSIPGARVAVETQRAKYEAARRRLQALEDDNRVLRQSEAEAQVRCDFCFRGEKSWVRMV